MPCPTAEQLREIVRGTLDEERTEQVFRHAEGCPGCAAALDTLLRRGDSLLLPLSASPSSETLPAGPGPRRGMGTAPGPDGPPPLPSVPGYEVLEEVGRGGMGVVYKARYLALGRLAALKMILVGSLASPEQRRRFRVEAELAARVQGPGIVQVFEVGEHDGRPFLALEWVGGGSLARRLAGQALPAREAAALVARLAGAVQTAHAHGVIHRDLKPANVLMGAGGTPRITDFGLAKLTQSDSGLTRPGDIVGTPEYMAPEQAAGDRQVGPLADVYALGCILYECLTGRPPLRGATVPDTLRLIGSAEPVRPRQLNPSVPRDLETICLKCLQKDPARRYASAEALADDLERWQAGEPIRARRVGELERAWLWARRYPAVAGLLAGVALALVGGLAFSLYFAFEANEQAQRAREQEADALAARDEARGREGEARAATRRADLQAAELALRLGLQEVAAGAVDRGLFRMLQAWRKAPADAPLRAVIRANVAGWSRQLPRLRLVFRVPPYRDIRQIDLGDPQGRTLLTFPHENNAICSWDLASGRPAGPPVEPPGKARVQGVSPDGRWVILGNEDGPGSVLDRLSGRPVAGLGWPDTRTNWVRFTDLRDVLLTYENGEHVLRQLPPGKSPPARLRHEEGLDLHLTRTADGRVVALLDRPGEGSRRIDPVDFATGRRLAQPPAGAPNPRISYDGRVFVSARDGAITWWDLQTGRPMGPAWTARGVTARQLGHDGLEIGAARGDDRARRYDLTTGLQRGGDLRHTQASMDDDGAHTWTPDGRLLCTLDRAATVRVWDTGLARLQSGATANPHTAPGRAVRQSFTAAYSPDGTRLALAFPEKDLAVLLDAQTGELLAPPMRQPEVHHLAFSPDGRHLATATFQGRRPPLVVLRDGRTGAAIGKPWPCPKLIHALAFSPDGKSLAVGGVGGTWVLDEPAHAPRHHLAEATCINGLAFHAGGRRLAVGTAAGWEGVGTGLRVWDVWTGQPLGPFRPSRSAFSPPLAWDGDELVCLDFGDTGLSRLAPDGRAVRRGPWPLGRVLGVGFRGDGRRMVAEAGGLEVRQWDTRTGDPVGLALTHLDRGCVSRYSADGKLLATLSGKAVYLWDAATGWPLGPPLRHASEPRAVAFADADRTLLCVTAAGVVHAWPVPRPAGDDPDRFEAWLLAHGGVRLAGEKVVQLTLDEWQSATRALRDRWPGPDPALAEPPDDGGWHRRQANHAREAGNERGELYHLGRLAELRPAEPAVQARLAALHAGVAGRLPPGPARDREWRLAREAARLCEGWRGGENADRLAALEAVRRRSWEEALWYLDRLVDRHGRDPALLADRAAVHDRRGEAALRDADWRQALACGGRRLEGLVPAVAEAWGRQERWQEVARLLQEQLREGPPGVALIQRLALAQLKAGDRAAHARLCRTLLEDRPETADRTTVSGLVEAAVWAPGALRDWRRPLAEMGRAVRALQEAESRSGGQAREYYRGLRRAHLTVHAAALHRAGRHAEAIERLKEAMKLSPGGAGGPPEWVWLALAHAATENRPEAARWLARARAAAPKRPDGLWEAVELELLLAEAARALGTESF